MSKVHWNYIITTDSVKIDHHDYMKDIVSQCVPRKHMYRRLCGTSLYEVSKYSYDDENHFWISSSRENFDQLIIEYYQRGIEKSPD